MYVVFVIPISRYPQLEKQIFAIAVATLTIKQIGNVFATLHTYSVSTPESNLLNT